MTYGKCHAFGECERSRIASSDAALGDADGAARHPYPALADNRPAYPAWIKSISPVLTRWCAVRKHLRRETVPHIFQTGRFESSPAGDDPTRSG